jgi:ABC-type dipeptide/oligopeptide/nickel transport system permease subunit
MNGPAAEVNEPVVRKRKKQSMTAAVVRRIMRNRISVIGFIILAILVIGAVAAPLIAPYSPTAMDYTSIHSKPTAEHLFGTDQLGRDIFSRCVYGARYSLTLGLITALTGAIVGLVFGTMIGYAGGQVDMVVMRICDVWASIPGTLIVILLATLIGTGFIPTIIAMSLGGFPHQIRGVRAMCLKEREQEYLEAALSINCRRGKIMFKHMLPNIMAPTIVHTTLGIGSQIINAAALSFIGLGIKPPAPEWGAMLSDGRSSILTQPHVLIFPGLMIALAVLSISMFGDGLRDALDPRLKD